MAAAATPTAVQTGSTPPDSIGRSRQVLGDNRPLGAGLEKVSDGFHLFGPADLRASCVCAFESSI
jgi:hypothetical protein